MTKTEPILHRYEVTSVWGDVPVNVKVGVVMRDKYMGLHAEWPIVDLTTGDLTGAIKGRYLGKAGD